MESVLHCVREAHAIKLFEISMAHVVLLVVLVPLVLIVRRLTRG